MSSGFCRSSTKALRKANLTLKDIDAVAVANTPGLAGSLLVGLVAAKSLCVALGVPLVAINHLQAHIYACRIAAGEEVFPCVGLIVSGGHSSLYRCRGPLDFELLGATIDDAAGEAFDKVAAMLGLPYPWRAIHPTSGRGRQPAGLQLPAIVPPRRRAARFQFQRAENGGPLYDRRSGQARHDEPPTIAGKSRRSGGEFSGSGGRLPGGQGLFGV